MAINDPRRARDRYEEHYEYAPVGYLSLMNDGAILEANLRAAKMFGLQKESLLRQNITDFVHRDSLSDFHSHRQCVFPLAGNRTSQPGDASHWCELQMRKQDGTCWAARLECVAFGQAFDRCRTVVIDVSEKRQAAVARRLSAERIDIHQRLFESNALLESILDSAADAIVLFDPRGNISRVNPAAEQMFGLRSEELVGQSFKLVIAPPYCGGNDGSAVDLLRTGGRFLTSMGRRSLGDDGQSLLFPIEVSINETISSEADGQSAFVAVIRDITERRHLQKQVLKIAAEDFKKIGMELHDDVQQRLTGLGLLARSLSEELAAHASELTSSATRLANGIMKAADRVHVLSHGVVVLDVSADALPAALEELAYCIREQYGVQCEFRSEGLIDLTDNFVATNFYRIAQEAVNNAIKHGRAKQIQISLLGSHAQVALSVTDDGVGLGDSLKEIKRGGLRIMQYRADLSGARLQIGPGEAGGTTICCTVVAAR